MLNIKHFKCFPKNFIKISGKLLKLDLGHKSLGKKPSLEIKKKKKNDLIYLEDLKKRKN